MTGSRLCHSGEVERLRDGCTAIRVSVPCSRCATGCGGFKGRTPGELIVPATVPVTGPATVSATPGTAVQVSVSADGLRNVAVMAFAPMLLTVGLVIAMDLLALSAVWQALIGVGAAALAMIAGRCLARSRLAGLDLQVTSASPVTTRPVGSTRERGAVI